MDHHENLLTGEGLEEATRGIDTIVHCASSPFRKASQTGVSGNYPAARRAREERVSYLVYISVVGIDRARPTRTTDQTEDGAHRRGPPHHAHRPAGHAVLRLRPEGSPGRSGGKS